MAPGLWPAVSTGEIGSQSSDGKYSMKLTYLNSFFDYDTSISSVVGWVNGRQEGQVDPELVGFQQSRLSRWSFYPPACSSSSGISESHCGDPLTH
jgi:hypothetical protein